MNEHLYEQYHNLVCKIANQCNLDADLEDLIKYGWIGLLEAKKKFDPSRGTKFATFAYGYIHGYIHMLHEESRLVRIRAQWLRVREVRRRTEKISQKNGYRANPDEVVLDGGDWDVSRFGVMQTALQAAMALEPFSTVEPQHLTAGDKGLDSVDAVDEVTTAIHRAKLTSSERRVIRHYFGLGRYQPKNTCEIAKQFGVTKRAVGYALTNGLQKIRSVLCLTDKEAMSA